MRDGVPDPAALTLAAYSAGLRFDDLPDAVVDAARRHLLDTVGVAIRGREQANAINALRAVEAIDGAAGGVAVWGSERRLASGYAALANGIAAHVLDFDDTHTDAIVHGSAILAPVVLGLGEHLHSTGDDIVTAFVAGWEVAARVGLASRGTFHRRGFHTTSVAGVFGAAVAAARLLGISAERTAHALGLAGSQASGINEYLSNGSSAKALHTGWSAHAGIVAARLAQAGMTGPMTVFEGRDGVLRTHGVPERSDASALVAELGTRFESTRVSIKPYPCCHFAHAFVDCAGALVDRGIDAASVTTLDCVVPQTEVGLICEPYAAKLAPATPYAAKFSLPFLIASRIVDGKIDHATFDEANLRRRELLDLAQRVRYRVAAPGETPFPRTFPGWVEASLSDGRRVVERLDVNAGHPDNPLSTDVVRAKFMTNASGTLGGEAALRLAEVVMALPATTADELGRALSTVPSSTTQLRRKMS
jgi:2-methylcitrate dehydratase PrpD